MYEFTSSFWNWYIIVPTVIGILAMFWLIRWLSVGQKRKPGEQVETMGHVWDGDLEEYNNPLPRWWLNLFYITLFFGIGYLVLYPGLGTFKGLLGWTSRGNYEQEMQQAKEKYGPIFEQYRNKPAAVLADSEDATKIGERLFSNYCATCHGADARGVPGFPNLRDSEWLYGESAEKIHETIAEGRQGMMPAWKETLSEKQIFDVAEYVRQLSGRSADPIVASRGKQIYQQNCAACHGPDGDGNQQMGAPRLTNNVWLYGGSQKQIIKSIRDGRQGRMPPHGEFLGDAKIHLLVGYILSISENAENEPGTGTAE
ncbi:MAG: cytochrome-c oxidase, cbb3-type subunit III [Gammaproteobacteria bacterium]|nr:cytochrome-c oxidase, cbb3-type subunit III [Gammaproteobacteria bacterium]